MTICVVVGCSTRSECIKNTNTSLHRFPKDPQIHGAWIKAVGRLNWQPTKNSVVCSKHFEESCFIRGPKYVKLHKKAIPTRFLSCPINHNQTKKIRADSVIYNVQTVPFDTMSKMQISSKVNSTSSYPNPVILNLSDCSSNQNPSENTRTSLVRHNIKRRSLDAVSGTQTSTEENSNDSCTSSSTLSGCEEDNFDDDDDDDGASLKRKLDLLSHKYEMAKKKIRRLQQINRQNDKKIANLEAVIEDLKSKNFIHEDNLAILCKETSSNMEFLAHQLTKHLGMSPEKQYSPELKAFALTLHHLSPKAYNYVRDVFDTCLPCEKTIKRWYQATDGKPGFTLEDFEILEPVCELVEDNVEDGH